jgi:hypothetical protein
MRIKRWKKICWIKELTIYIWRNNQGFREIRCANNNILGDTSYDW